MLQPDSSVCMGGGGHLFYPTHGKLEYIDHNPTVVALVMEVLALH